MIYLTLFLTFLQIGAFSFGGGYGMISLIREVVVGNGWLTEEQFLSFIAVAESTPGPLAVNMATFIGSSLAGLPGALVATLGVVLPSFIIIALIAAVMKNIMKYEGVKRVLAGIQPAIAGMIVATAAITFMTYIFGFTSVGDGWSFNWKSLVILGVIAAIAVGWRLWKKKSFSPILLIIISGGLGIILHLIA